MGRDDCPLNSDWAGMYLFARERDRLATVLAAAMRTSAPVRAESARPAWEGTRSRGVSPTAAGSSARMCSMVCRGSPASLWSSSYMTVPRAGSSRKACAFFSLTSTALCRLLRTTEEWTQAFLLAEVTGTKLQSTSQEVMEPRQASLHMLT